MAQGKKPKAFANKNTRYYYLLALIPFLFMVIMYELLPLLMLIVDSFHPEGKSELIYSLDNYKKIFTTLSYKRAILNSLEITSISTIFGIVIALWGRGLPIIRGEIPQCIYDCAQHDLQLCRRSSRLPI